MQNKFFKDIPKSANKKWEKMRYSTSLNNEDVLHPSSFKTIIRFQQKDKTLIEIAMEKPIFH